MQSETEIILAYVTFPDKNMAHEAALKVVQKNCAAGANITGPIQSIFHWNSKVCKRQEWLMFAQTTSAAFDDFTKIIKNIHSDSVPCILGLPIVQAWDPFKGWILENCQCNTQNPQS